MDMRKCHVGDVRQYVLAPGEAPELEARLHVPVIQLPRDTEEQNLHGDVPGSWYSSTPGELSRGDAARLVAEREEEERKARVRSTPTRGSKA